MLIKESFSINIITYMLNGYKTYIFGALAIVSVILKWGGLIDEVTLLALLGIFLSSEGMSLRSAIANK